MINADILIIAGGGGGGSDGFYAGGGGAGELIHLTNQSISLGEYSVTVGAGGAPDVNGQDSVFNSITALGGGAGGDRSDSGGNNGGSGGGANDDEIGGTATPNQGLGNNGGNGSSSSGGGGGGAGTAGQTAPSNLVAGDGGDGVQVAITGTSIYYAGGGAGARGGQTGGLGGGGDTSVAGEDGKGAGGGSSASGGSGVVIVRYLTADTGDSTGGTKTTDGSYTVHTFTSSGTLNLVAPPTLGVQTDPVTDITKTSATLNGEITDVGETNVTERGFVISTSSHADPGNVSPAASSYESVENETGNFSAGTFIEALAGLDDGTTYYIRVYAKDSDEYLYGDEVSFETDLQKLEIHGRNYVA